MRTVSQTPKKSNHKPYMQHYRERGRRALQEGTENSTVEGRWRPPS